MKKNKELIVLFVSAVLMSGCTKTMWVNPNVTNEQAQKDNADCQYDVVKNTPTYDGVSDPIAAGIAEATRKNDILKACYTAKGYSLQAQQEPTKQQKSVDDKYSHAIDTMKKKNEPISEYITNVCAPKEDKEYINCLNGKNDDIVAASFFPDITIKKFNTRKEFEQQLIRKEITRKEFKEDMEKLSNDSGDQAKERIKNDLKTGIYTGKY